MLGIGKRGAKVSVVGEEGSKSGSVAMSVDSHGGLVSVYGKGSSTSRAIMGVDEYGNGVVGTWDKNGYRQ